MGTLNEDVRDRLIEQDVANQRAIGGIQNRVDDRLRELTRALRTLVVDSELDQGTPAARQRKLDALAKESSELIDQAFRDINDLTRNAAGRMAVVDAAAVEEAIAIGFAEVPGDG